MTITFHNKFRDRLAFAVYHTPRNPLAIIMTLGIFALFTFETILPATRAVKTNQPLAVKIFSFVIVESLLALFLATLWFVIIILAMISRRNKTFFCEKKMTVGDEGFVVETPYGKSEIRWQIVQKLARTRRHIIMYTGQDNAIIIPRRDFETSNQWDDFYNYCRNQTNSQ